MICDMKTRVYGMLASMCLILGGCGAQENIHGQSEIQSIEEIAMQNTNQNASLGTDQSAGPEKEQEKPKGGSGEDVYMWKEPTRRIFDDGSIDIEILCNCDYFLWNQNMGQTILVCPYDEVHLLSKGYEELDQAMDALNSENADSMGVFYDKLREQMEGRIEAGEMFEGFEILPFEFSRTISILRSDEAIVSLEMIDYEWTGWLHPNYYFHGINFDSLTGQKLSLADVVTDYDRIYELVLEQLASEEYMDEEGHCVLVEGYEEIVKQEFYPQEPEDEQVKWWLDTEGLTVGFDVYELASYAEGNLMLEFSFEELGDLVKPKYIYPSEDGSR